MSFVAKYFRLLPAVVVVGTGLLALKGVDLARAAQAPASEYSDPDNSGLAPTDNGGAPATRDFASDDAASGSASEVDVLSSLTRRRAELDARERALAMRENILSAGEGRVDQKIGALKTLQSQIQALLAQRDAKQDDQIKSLIKTYGPDGMKTSQAAAIFNTMPDEVLIPIARGMKPGDLGAIMSVMKPDAAQRLTIKLASQLKLPDPPAAVCPDPATATPASTDIVSPVTNPVVSLNPPVTTAALSNPTVTPLPLPPAPTPTVAPPPAPTPAPATPPKPQASTPPKPSTPPAHHPAKPVTPPPAKPTTASATPPVKPVAPPPAKPASAASALPVTAPTPAPATTPPAKPSTQATAAPLPASAPPTPLTPAHGG